MMRLDNRSIYKTVYSLKLDEVREPQNLFEITDNKIKDIEGEISEDLGVDKDYIMLDIPEYPNFQEMSTIVTVNGHQEKLRDISSIVKALNVARFNHADLCIYMPDEYSNKAVDFPFNDYIPLEF
jgi:hypothetical protein